MLEGGQLSIKSPSLGRQKAVLWLAFLIILSVSLLAFFSIQRLVALSERVEHTQNILVETNRFLFDLKDIENSGRGYFLTGNDRFLRGQNAGIANVRSSVDRLRTLQGVGDLGPRLDGLFSLAAKRIELSRLLVSQRANPDEAGRTVLLGTRVMDRIRNETTAIIAAETNTYRQDRQSLERQAWLTSFALAIGVVLCLGTIGWLFSIRGREVELRRQLEGELRALNLELEDRVQERTAEVKRAKDLLNAVVENLPDMIFLKEAVNDFRYLLLNAAGEKLLGRGRDDVVGKIDHELFPRAEAELFLRDSKEVADTGRSRVFPDRLLTTPDGVRTIESRNIPIANGNGSHHLVLGIVRDITGPRAVEEQLRQLQRMEAVGRLTGGVAHDFNNLLAIIHGNSELLRNEFDEGTEAAEMTDDVIGAATRGAELVRRLLAFARMQHLEPESVDLNARLPNIIGLLKRSLGENVQVQLKSANGLWPAIADPTQVDDALVNLAINARDAMSGGGTLSIETQNVYLDEDYAAHHVEVTPGEYVMLAVSDSGSGMSPDVVARAFEPFFTTKEEGQGTGLGLSQVFGWVKQTGGHIKIYSELGHGTTIKLYLPRAAAPSAGVAAEPEITTPKGDETILVVEDNPNVRKTVIRQLHDLGYKTVEADSGAHALQLIKDGTAFDLLLTDVVMPGGITGYQLAEQLRGKWPNLKVLFTSGYTELAAASGQPVRKDPLLSKPYRKQDLGRAVRAALD